MNRNLENALRVQDKGKENKKTELSGKLGVRISDQDIVEVPNRSGFHYCYLNENSELVQAFNDKTSPIFGLPVIVVWNVNRYEVQEIDKRRYGTWNSNYLPKHGNQHSFNPEGGGAGDVAFIYGKQFVPLSLTPSGTFGASVGIISPYSQLQGTWNYIPATTTPNIVAHKPTDNQAKMVLVCMDWTTRNAQIIVGSTLFSSSLTGTADVLPYLPSTTGVMQIPIAGVRLVSGTTAVTWQNIYDVRQYFHPIFTGTSSGGGGGGGGTGSSGGCSELITLASASNNIDQTVSTIADLTNMSVSYDQIAGRTYYHWLTFSGNKSSSSIVTMYLTDASNNVLATLIGFAGNVTYWGNTICLVEVASSSANVTRKIRCACNAGSITFDNDTATMEYWVTPSELDGCGGGTSVNANGFFGLDEGVPLGTGTFLNVVGAGATLTLSGTMFNLNIPGGGGGGSGIGIVGWDEGVFQATGTILNVTGQRATLSASGTVLNLNISPDPQELIGVYGLANGIPLGTGTWIDFGNNLIATISGTTLRLDATVGGAGQIGIMGWDEGVPIGTGTVINVVGSRASLSASGTILNLTISPDPMDNIGIMAYDDATPIGTGTSISFGNNLAVVRTGTFLYVDAQSSGGGSAGAITVYDDGVFIATGTKISFNTNLNVTATGTSVFVDAPITTYFRVGQPSQLSGNFWRVPDRVYASGSLGIFNNGAALTPGVDYVEQIYVSGTYQYLSSSFSGTPLAFYGVPCSPQFHISTGTSGSLFDLQDSSSVLLLDSNGIQLLDSNG